MYAVQCPHCGSVVDIPDDAVGKHRTHRWNVARCDDCNTGFDYDDEEMCPGFSEERISAVSNAHRLNAAISPNPAKDRCRIVFDRPMNGALIVRNLHGQAVRSINVSETTILDLNTQELPSGIYLLEAHTEEAQQFLTKLAIIR